MRATVPGTIWWGGLAGVALFCLVFATLLRPAAVANFQRISAVPHATTIASLTHDFGRVRALSKVAHDFEIVNDSAVAWTVARTGSGCSCAVASLSRDVVPPGESLRTTVEFRAPARAGLEYRPLEVAFREPEAPLVRLFVQADVYLPLAIQPALLEFQLSGSAPPAQAARIVNFDPLRWPELQVLSAPDWVRVEIGPPLIGPDAGLPEHALEQWPIRVEVVGAPAAGSDELIDRIQFGVPGPDGATGGLGLRVRRTDHVRVFPSQLTLAEQPASLQSQTLVLVWPAGTSPDWAHVQIEYEGVTGLDAQWESQTETRGVLRIRLTSPPAQSQRGVLHVHLQQGLDVSVPILVRG